MEYELRARLNKVVKHLVKRGISESKTGFISIAESALGIDTAITGTKLSTDYTLSSKLEVSGNYIQIKVPSVPDAPTALTTTFNPSYGNILITVGWTPPSDPEDAPVTGFKVYRDNVLIATIGDLTSYDDNTVELFHSYTYTVKATNAVGDSVASSAATEDSSNSYTSMNITVPAIPTTWDTYTSMNIGGT